MLCDRGEVFTFSEDLALSRSEELRGKSSLGWLPDFWHSDISGRGGISIPWEVGGGVSGQSAQSGKRGLIFRSGLGTWSHLLPAWFILSLALKSDFSLSTSQGAGEQNMRQGSDTGKKELLPPACGQKVWASAPAGPLPNLLLHFTSFLPPLHCFFLCQLCHFYFIPFFFSQRNKGLEIFLMIFSVPQADEVE